jgi:hypothetical protein
LYRSVRTSDVNAQITSQAQIIGKWAPRMQRRKKQMTAHILLVEDEIKLARFIELELGSEGYRVRYLPEIKFSKIFGDMIFLAIQILLRFTFAIYG